MDDQQKFVILTTHGPEDPELATIPFVIGVAALASDVDVVVGLQADAVRLARSGGADGVEANEFPPLAKLFIDFRDLGGTLYACGTDLKRRGIPTEELAEGVQVVGAGTIVAEIAGATHSLVY